MQRTIHVLVVDDDQALCDSIAEALGAAGFAVSKACDGQDAMAALHRTTAAGKPLPDVVLLDLMMPNMTGREFCEEVQKTPWRHLPVVGLTASDTERLPPPYLTLVKPFDTKLLVNAITVAATHGRLEREEA